MGTFSKVLKGGGSWHSKVSCAEKLKKSIVNSRSLSFPESILRPGSMEQSISISCSVHMQWLDTSCFMLEDVINSVHYTKQIASNLNLR